MSAALIGVLVAQGLGLPCPAGAADPYPPAYPLDEVPRTLPERAPLPCEAGGLPLVSYNGERLRYQKPVQVHQAFRAQLSAFEQIVEQVALAHYGRTPQRVVHMGGYNCRRMRRYPDWVSEHALGNAIDIAGFDFGPLARGAALPSGLPRALRSGFQVRLQTHWDGKGSAEPHSRFLRALAQALIDRPDVFHVVLGPAWPGHKNHFHLDHAPYRVVEVF
ncbi:MAG TPA: extensin family protein [Polyangiales bacterium]